MNSNTNIELDYGNCAIVRFRGKEAYVKDVSLRTGTWYKADGMVELAPHSEAVWFAYGGKCGSCAGEH